VKGLLSKDGDDVHQLHRSYHLLVSNAIVGHLVHDTSFRVGIATIVRFAKHLDAIAGISHVEAASSVPQSNYASTTPSPPSARASKTELIHRKGTWRNVEHVEWATLNYLDWFNNRRFLESLDCVDPVEFEKSYYCSSERESLPALEMI
jgi:transposase InsO family protein